MSFSSAERAALLALKGVGPTVLQRLEQMGLDSFVRLRDSDAASILAQGAALTGSSCWKNSPQARAAIAAVLQRAASDARTMSTYWWSALAPSAWPAPHAWPRPATAYWWRSANGWSAATPPAAIPK